MLGEQTRHRNNYMVTEVWVNEGRSANEDICGYLAHTATGRAWRFAGLVNLMKYFEKLFNAANYPQATHRMRGMDAEEEQKRPTVSMEDIAMDVSEIKSGKPTFVINVQHRQNATWQGTIKWLEGSKETQFRSALELIKLMDGVVSERDETDWK